MSRLKTLWGCAVYSYFKHCVIRQYWENHPTEIYAKQDIIDANILASRIDKNRWKVPTKLFNDFCLCTLVTLFLSVISVQLESTNQLLIMQWCGKNEETMNYWLQHFKCTTPSLNSASVVGENQKGCLRFDNITLWYLSIS